MLAMKHGGGSVLIRGNDFKRSRGDDNYRLHSECKFVNLKK